MGKERKIVNDVYKVDDKDVGNVGNVSENVGVIVFERDVTSEDLSSIPFDWDVVVHGNVYLVSNVTIKCNLFVTGNIEAYKDEAELYSLSVEGTLFCEGHIDCGEVVIAGDLVCGKSVKCYEINILGELICKRVISGNVRVNEDMTVDTGIYSSGVIFVNGNINLKGDAYCKALRVQGYAYLESNLRCKLCCIICGELYCYGNIYALTTVKVSRKAYIYGNLQGKIICMPYLKMVGDIKILSGKLQVEEIEMEGSISTSLYTF